MRALGVDPGVRRIGLALSDEDRILASPHAVVQVRTPGEAIAELARVVAEREVSTVVVGLPLKLDGREGEAARRARAFAAALQRACDGVELVLWDERLTTVAAERSLREGGVRGKRQRAAVDKVAAALLLQSYLDAQRRDDGGA